MKLEEKILIVKRAYKSVYKCDDYIVKVLMKDIRSQMYLMRL